MTDGYHYDEFGEPYCDECGSDMEWETCWNCGGEGGRGWEDLQFEDPLWYDEDDWIDCDICEGKGGYLICLNVKNHPTTVTDAAPTAAPDGEGDA